MIKPRVISLSKSDSHTFNKYNCEKIALLEGLGVEGDAHSGKTVKHRSRVAKDPTQPNLRQVHLIHSELFDELAEKDLTIRGPGDFLGSRQWGIPDLTMASLADAFSVEKAKNEAKEILQKDPQLIKYPLLREKLKQFKERIHLE